jgi:transcriptional regulator with XRE-family HTH domain
VRDTPCSRLDPVVYARRMSRPHRLHPRERVVDWPNVPAVDPVDEVARLFAKNVEEAIGKRTLREAGELVGVDFSTLAKIVNGATWPDLETIAKLEQGFGVDLWPGRVSRDE